DAVRVRLLREQLEIDALLQRVLLRRGVGGLCSHAAAPHRLAVHRRDLDIVGRGRRQPRGGRTRRRRRWWCLRAAARDEPQAERDKHELPHDQSRCTSASRAISLPTEITATPITITSTVAT